ncbi:nucleoside phosphorylase [Vibrio mediterranei]
MSAHTLHTKLTSTLINNAKIAILPDDPMVVPLIASHFESRMLVSNEREFVSYNVKCNNTDLIICSTGIGASSLAIVVEELSTIGVQYFIRSGTSGTIQEFINPLDIIVSNAAVRCDGVSNDYLPIEYPAVSDMELTHCIVKALKSLKLTHYKGITVSTASFHEGQGWSNDKYGESVITDWRDVGCLNFDMETAALFSVCRKKGLYAASFTSCIVNRVDVTNPKINEEIYSIVNKQNAEVLVLAVDNLIKDFY